MIRHLKYLTMSMRSLYSMVNEAIAILNEPLSNIHRVYAYFEAISSNRT